MAKKTTRFGVIVGLPPGQQSDWPHGFNFYFRIQDQTDPTQWALYLFGTVADTSVDIPLPESWSLADHVTSTPQPLSVGEWSGKAIYIERNENNAIRTTIWIGPDVLNGLTFPVGLRVSINKPQPGISSSSTSSYPFRLRAISPDVDFPRITSLRNRLRKIFIPHILLSDE